MEGGGASPAERVLAPSSSHSESAAAPLAQALDSALAMMMDDRITSLKQYFEDQQAQNDVRQPQQQVVAVGEVGEEKRWWEGCGCWSWSRLRWAARAHRLAGSRSRARLTSSRRR